MRQLGLADVAYSFGVAHPGAITLRNYPYHLRNFTRTNGERIDLSVIDADSIRNGNQSFSFIGSNPFSNVKGQLRVQQSGAHAIVSGDVNGNGVADFEIVLLNFSNLAGMTRFDFIR